jgi:DNA replication initiation complex subunit (GINS family)
MPSFCVQRLDGRELVTTPITEAAYTAALASSSAAPKPAPQEATSVLPPAADPAVRILVDVPPFVGTDEHTHVLKAGDIAVLPSSIAHLLVRRGKAQLVAEATA